MADTDVKAGDEVFENAKRFAEMMVNSSNLFDMEGGPEQFNAVFQAFISKVLLTSFLLTAYEESVRRGQGVSWELDRLIPNFIRKEFEDPSRLIDTYLAKVEENRARAKADLEEIENLRSETREMISQLLAA